MDIRPHLVKPPLERFMALIKVSAERFHKGTPCWEWQGSKSKDGYGQFVLSARRSEVRVRNRALSVYLGVFQRAYAGRA
jgi:hypothetical protein